MFALLVDVEFWFAFQQTVVGWVVGVAIAVVLGVPVGMFLGRIHFAYISTRLLIDFLRTIPSVAVIPLITLLFGATVEMKVILVVYGAFWPLVLQMIYGVRDTDKVLVDTMRSYRVPKWRAAAWVLFPSSLPYLITGIRISIVVGLLLAVSAEILGSAPGIGLELALAQTGGDLSLTYAYIVFIGLVGVVVDLLLRWGSRRLLFWHASVRESNS
jgi:ABC-type nitrate/sulfonate/bicarbonate transport system permease component